MIMERMNASSYKLDGLAVLDHLGVIEVKGPDAASFLHGQLTQDVALLAVPDARLAAWCSAKGRMLASFILFKTGPEHIWLLCSKDLLAATLKRLAMFVLRAKCQLRDATSDFWVLGAAGQAIPPSHPEALSAWRHWSVDNTHWVSLHPAADTPRALGLMPKSDATPASTLSASDWMLGEVLSGVATISQPVADAFVPQMLNYESVGGVNFKKGCYPGQEVVARSQFRGTLKRRAFVLKGAAPMQAGQDIFSSADATQPCGAVVQAAIANDGHWWAISSLQLNAAEQALHLAAPDGPDLHLQPLPYALLEVV
jgi:tRNA-modifying protein YgfZ